MSALKLVLGLLLAALVQAVGERVSHWFSSVVDPFLIVAVYHSLGGRPLWSALAGTAAGLGRDTLSGGPYGLHGFADTAVAYLSALLQQRLVIQQPSQVGLLFALAAALQVAILALTQYLLLPAAELPSPRIAAERMLATGLVGAGLYAAGGRLLRIEERRKAKRRQRPRMSSS